MYDKYIYNMPTEKQKKPGKVVCMARDLKKGERRGSMSECADKKQIRYFGVKKVDKILLNKYNNVTKKGSKKSPKKESKKSTKKESKKTSKKTNKKNDEDDEDNEEEDEGPSDPKKLNNMLLQASMSGYISRLTRLKRRYNDVKDLIAIGRAKQSDLNVVKKEFAEAVELVKPTIKEMQKRNLKIPKVEIEIDKK